MAAILFWPQCVNFYPDDISISPRDANIMVAVKYQPSFNDALGVHYLPHNWFRRSPLARYYLLKHGIWHYHVPWGPCWYGLHCGGQNDLLWNIRGKLQKSTLVQVMAWCHQATSHYLSQYWIRSMLQYGVTRLQWVNVYECILLIHDH